jgi:signal transduction histidine kinase
MITERQVFIDQLRPFVTSQQLFDRLLAAAPTEVQIEDAFDALCKNVLDTRQAYLIAQGPLAPLVGNALVYPTSAASEPPNLTGILGPWITPENICLPLPQEAGGDWRWAVPLWSERGLIGVLVLGPKQANGLYVQEEIEIARTVGERLIDTQASAEISRRLMDLQRQRLAESQIVDQRTRRVLHDEILPHLHAALLSLNALGQPESEIIASLSNAHRQISDLLRELPMAITPEITRQGLVLALRKMVESEFTQAFESVTWDIPVNVEAQMAQFSPLVLEVVFFAAREAIRNAARHGGAGDLGPALRIAAWDNDQALELDIENDCAAKQGNSPAVISSGQGLALHSTLMAVIGGELSFEQKPKGFNRVVLRVPKDIQ